jgi:putative hydrolase of the HAD superfamily
MTVPIRAVTFDYWNTIVRPDPAILDARMSAWRAHYRESGHDVEEDRLRSAFAEVWRQHQDAWVRNVQYTGLDAAQTAVDLVGLPIDDAGRVTLVELFTRQQPGVQLCEGAADLILGLYERGVRLGIVCDVGFTPSPRLRDILEGFRLLGCFAGWSFSDEVGRYKPATEIFQHALGYLAVEPEEVAHIGDLRRTDVAGGRAMGMVTVRYRGAYDDESDGPEADHVVDHHDQVPSALGLSRTDLAG